jgi:hypothetical protein
VTFSGTNYLPGKLATQVRSVLAGGKTAGLPDASGSGESPSNEPASISNAQLRACVTLITGGVAPSLVDEASYQGHPATIIVQAPAGERAGQVWVVSRGCSAGHRDLIAHAELPAQG